MNDSSNNNNAVAISDFFGGSKSSGLTKVSAQCILGGPDHLNTTLRMVSDNTSLEMSPSGKCLEYSVNKTKTPNENQDFTIL